MTSVSAETGEPRNWAGVSPIVSVVDDDVATCEALGDLFEAAGFLTYRFNDAEEFLRSDAPRVSSLLITDIQMNGIDGLALLDLVVGVGQKLPVILITARPEEELRRRATAKGCAAFFRKPFDPVLLLCHVKAAIGCA
jgi:FixJ family two-component response regulator